MSRRRRRRAGCPVRRSGHGMELLEPEGLDPATIVAALRRPSRRGASGPAWRRTDHGRCFGLTRRRTSCLGAARRDRRTLHPQVVRMRHRGRSPRTVRSARAQRGGSDASSAPRVPISYRTMETSDQADDALAGSATLRAGLRRRARRRWCSPTRPAPTTRSSGSTTPSCADRLRPGRARRPQLPDAAGAGDRPRAEVRASVRAALERGEPIEFELLNYRKDGIVVLERHDRHPRARRRRADRRTSTPRRPT